MHASWQAHHDTGWFIAVLLLFYAGVLGFPLVRYLRDRKRWRRSVLTNADLYRAAKQRRVP